MCKYKDTNLGIKTFEIKNGVETVTIVAALGALLARIMGISAQNYYANEKQTVLNEDDALEMLDDEYEDWDDEYEIEDEEETEEEEAKDEEKADTTEG